MIYGVNYYILIQREAYPSGFFIVLVVKGDDKDCVGVPSINSVRQKKVILTIKATITKEEYFLVLAVTICCMVGFCLVYIIAIVITKIRNGRKLQNEMLDNQNTDDKQSPSVVEEVTRCQIKVVYYYVERNVCLFCCRSAQLNGHR